MSGRGPAPKAQRRRTNKPARGEAVCAPGHGWQHGEHPAAPDGLLEASRLAWSTWFGAWFAAHWSEADVPGLRTLILLYDRVERGEFQRSAELRLWLDTYGITPKGQQDRRWTPPPTSLATPGTSVRPDVEYGHLRSIPNTEPGGIKQ